MAYKKIFLTFDDGPGTKTVQIAEELHALGIKATFFMVGQNIEKRPDAVKMVAELGHTIGVHAYTHADPRKLDAHQLEQEIGRTAERIEELTGKKPTLLFG